jgi:hypothetical protein
MDGAYIMALSGTFSVRKLDEGLSSTVQIMICVISVVKKGAIDFQRYYVIISIVVKRGN